LSVTGNNHKLTDTAFKNSLNIGNAWEAILKFNILRYNTD